MTNEFLNTIQYIHQDKLKILKDEWEDWAEDGYGGLVPDKLITEHIQLAKINGDLYIKLDECGLKHETNDYTMIISCATQWFNLDLMDLIQNKEYDEAIKEGFMLCPFCGGKSFTHVSEDSGWSEDTCESCNKKFNAIDYDWANKLVGYPLYDFGKFLSGVKYAQPIYKGTKEDYDLVDDSSDSELLEEPTELDSDEEVLLNEDNIESADEATGEE